MDESSDRVRLDADSKVPPEVRERFLAEVQSRLDAGELDSDLALIETAVALLDGDCGRGVPAKGSGAKPED